MRWKGKFALGLATALAGAAGARAQLPSVNSTLQVSTVQPSSRVVSVTTQAVVAAQPEQSSEPGNQLPPQNKTESAEETPGPLGPTPLNKVGILQGLIFGDRKDAPINVSGWADFDYTFRSTGPGVNNIAPVMNRFGDEFLTRQLGILISKPTTEELSWGFNALFIGGADASFLGPTAGGWANTNPRFGAQFTDLNLTAHLPILTDGGVDIKAGRQTTILGPVGAMPWQRPFDSSDYAWYNLEEGRYTGVSTVWHVNKQLDWYNGIEIGGWGVFFADQTHNVNYITNVSYWLDEEAKKTRVWTTVLTGPTSFTGSGLFSTVFELGLTHNYNDYWYQTIDTQMTWSLAPIFGPVPPGYKENAYDVYTYIGRHLDCHWDINARAEWYYDQNGGGYPGGFGIANTNYFALTVGPDYHPTKWLQIRPEIRYDHATNPAFGATQNERNQLSLAFEALFKF